MDYKERIQYAYKFGGLKSAIDQALKETSIFEPEYEQLEILERCLKNADVLQKCEIKSELYRLMKIE